MGTKSISEVFAKLADLAIALGITDINKLEGCWEHNVDEHWFITINGHNKTIKNSKDVEVPAYHCYVEFNGWPAGIFSPFGGAICAGKLANEDTFLDAIKKALQFQEYPNE